MRKLFTILIASSLLFACNKEKSDLNNANSSGEEVVPFFELAKGDTISKDICREKPNYDDYENQNDIELLFCTENTLKSTGITDGSNNPILDLYASVRKKNNVGNYLFSNEYRKIPVDLNQGSGGKWIYLFYDRAEGYNCASDEIAITGIRAKAQSSTFLSYHGISERVVDKYRNNKADLNEGAGGKHVYLIQQHKGYPKFSKTSKKPIRHLAIVSGNNSSIKYRNYKKVYVDLNKGAGGKYIYLFYKK